MSSEPKDYKWESYIFLTLAMFISVILLIVVQRTCDVDIDVNPGYLVLALVGVVFHMSAKIREIRDSGGKFELSKYWFDYVFRAFQACIYVFVLTNLLQEPDTDKVDKNPPQAETVVAESAQGEAGTAADATPASPTKLKGQETGTESSGQKNGSAGKVVPPFEYPFALLSLFVGMYIRRVEEAFVSLGDRFGDTINGVVGSKMAPLSEEETRLKARKIGEDFLDWKEVYKNLTPRPGPKTALKMEDYITNVDSYLQRDMLEAASNNLLKLELMIKEYQRSQMD